MLVLLDKFNGDLFRRTIEKVKAQSMIEVEFVFNAGVTVRDVLGIEFLGLILIKGIKLAQWLV